MSDKNIPDGLTSEQIRKWHEYVKILDTMPNYTDMNFKKDRPSWDSIWMDLALRLSERSTCDRASVGCVVVSEDNAAVIGMGYNGGPKGLNNECLSSEPGRCGHLHAEINALIKTNYRYASKKKAYVTTSPCYTCAVALINADISEVIYRTAYRDLSGVDILKRAGVQVRQFPEEGVP